MCAHETRIKPSGLDPRIVERRAAELNGRISFLPFIYCLFLVSDSLIIACGMNADIFCAFKRFVYVCVSE